MPGYSDLHVTVGEDQVPALRGAGLESIPVRLLACDDLARDCDRRNSGVHFFRADSKFASLVSEPRSWLARLEGFQSILTPDLTIQTGMPRHLRAQITVASRGVGVVLESHGYTVIPAIRAIIPQDYAIVAAGIPTGSVIAFGAYSLQREPDLRARFEHGVHAMIEMIQPEAVMIYGSTRPIFRAQVEAKTDLCLYAHPLHEARVLKRERLYPPKLF